jgi:iron complex outermembrane receptor protein
MSIEVTSVSKKAESLSLAAAAIYVVTGDEIRRSGATTIADALRFVPGLQAARISSNWWAVTSRGFAGNFANKLLVLIDGRSVYTPFYAGVYWDAQDVLLEDIDRIEVIRGPGAALWGSNAVNGVINVITKDAAKTQGLLLRGAAGTKEKALGAARVGLALGEHAAIRVYTKYSDRDEYVDTSGTGMDDGWDRLQSGFRLDWTPSDSRRITLKGDLETSEAGLVYDFPLVVEPYWAGIADTSRFQGGNVIFRWTESLSPRSDLALQAYFDRTDRNNIRFSEEHNTTDLDFQHAWRATDHAELVWGLGYRSTADKVDSVRGGYTVPGERTADILSGFAQADVGLFGDEVHVTLGSKFEDNDYTGFEAQPNARFRWLPAREHSVWGAVSRAVRTPSRVEQDGVIEWETAPPYTGMNPGPYPVLVTLYSAKDYRSEVLTAYEAGYRFRPDDRFAVDLAAFYNRYERIRTVEAGEPEFMGNPVSWIRQPFHAANGAGGQSYGAELAADWRASDRLRIRAGYSALSLDLWMTDPEKGMEIEKAEGSSPEHQAFGRASLDLPRRFDVDLGVRYVGELPEMNIESYVTVDARVGWRPNDHWEIFASGTNLEEPRHAEFSPGLRKQVADIQSAAYGGVLFRY